ncbi:hypothetical protein SAMN05445504_7625 [Burkholderia sp. CF099]|jgi:transposase|nr:hypothetical protein SAMN05445504_7625 [Burkholderia sp. CF099]
MTENQDLHSRLVVGQKRGGRHEYDEGARDALIRRLCLQPGKPIARYQRTHPAMSAPGTQSDGDVIDVTPSAVPAVMAPAFVPVVTPASQPAAKPQRLTLALGVRMANGVHLNLGEATLEEFATLIQILGRIRIRCKSTYLNYVNEFPASYTVGRYRATHAATIAKVGNYEKTRIRTDTGVQPASAD